jgi:hypothetical protein
VLQFVKVFHAALKVLMDCKEAEAHEAVMGDDEAAEAVESPQLRRAVATPDVQVSIGTISGSAFGSSLPHSSSSRESAASPPGDSAEEEETLWGELSALDTEQLTAVMEDAGAVLWNDGSFDQWFDVVVMEGEPGPDGKGRYRRFVPAYADIFDAVDAWMDKRKEVEREEVERGGWWMWQAWWKKQCWDAVGALGECRWWAIIVLIIYEIAFGLLPFVLSLELSSWARYNLWAYLVLHSAAFFKIVWMYVSSLKLDEESEWNGNCSGTDLLLVSIAVLVRTRGPNPSSFPRLSLRDILRETTDALKSLVASGGIMGKLSLARIILGMGLTSEPEPKSSKPKS